MGPGMTTLARGPGGDPGARCEDLARAGVTQITLFNYTVPGLPECDRSLLNVPIRDEISPSNLNRLNSFT